MTRKVSAWKLLRVSRKGERHPVPGEFLSKKDARLAAEAENKRIVNEGEEGDRFIVVPAGGYEIFFKKR